MSNGVVAIANQKGGVGKTVTAVNVAACAAAKGMRVLVVDLDPQGHASLALQADAAGQSGAAALLEGAAISDVARLSPCVDRLDVVSADLRLETAARAVDDELWLARALAPARARWDLIVLDTPPGSGPQARAAILATDRVIAPVAGGALGVVSTVRWLTALTAALALVGLELRARCALTRFRTTHNISRDARAALASAGLPRFAAVIRESVLVERSLTEQLPLTKLRPGSGPARDYARLTDELLAEVRRGP